VRSKLFVLAAGLLLVAGCAKSATDVLWRADPAYDFKVPHSYKWGIATLSDKLPANTPDPEDLDQRIQAAVDAVLKKRGYLPSETPDLLVTYQVQVSNRVPNPDDPPPASWDPGTDITKYASASLMLHFTNAKDSETVWRGAAITDVQKGQGRKRVQEVVEKLMLDFPPPPPEPAQPR